MTALSLHRFLMRFALAGANIFAWIFAFQYFFLVEPDIAHALARTALLYALSQAITCLVTPYGARALRGGARRMLLYAAVSAAAAFAVLGAAFVGVWGGAYAPEALIVFAVALGIYRALYWIPFELEARATRASRLPLAGEFVIALAPLASGLFIAFAAVAPVWLLDIGAALIVLSALPIYFMAEVHEGFSWEYRETFAQLWEPENRTIVTQSFFEGLSGATLLFFWPIAVFLITGWSYGMLGIILSFTFVVAILARTFVRKLLRRARLQQSGFYDAVFAVTPWLFRLSVATPIGVILADSYFYTTTPPRMGIDTVAFEQSADGGSYVDEYTALKEMSLALGRIVICVVGAGTALKVSLPVAFVTVISIAAIASVIGVLAYR